MSRDGSHPERLGVYRLESSLGRGGMGEVFLAWDERLERHVAIKRILPDPVPDERARERFRREARAAARLSHPAIVQVFDLLESDDGDCLVMEYVEGSDLARLIAAGELDLDLDTVLRLGAEIAGGLAEAHARGLIHRDLKPENVRVTRSGRRAKILDFGLARLLWSEGMNVPTLTEKGALMGTVPCMSPEQAGGRAVDHRSDLFAFGGLLYEMLAGRSPFRGDNLLDTLRRITSEDPAPLAELRPDLPPELVEMVEGLLAKAPDERPPNARVVAGALERLYAQRLSGSETLPPAPRAETPGLADDGTSDLPTGEWPAIEKLPSETAAPGVRPPGRAPRTTAVWLTVLLTVALALAYLRPAGEQVPENLPAGRPGKPTVAVLPFQNLNADPDLEWLSTGLPEMLVIDLSQSREIDVLGLGRLERMLRDPPPTDDASADRTPPPDPLPGLAKGGVDMVLAGSFVRAGDSLRVYLKIQQAANGEILLGAQREGALDAGLFSIVDDLSRTVRRHLEVPRHDEMADTVLEVTTSSLEAWRHFTEGMTLYRKSKEREALVLLEQAVSLDPQFALALANLGLVQGALGHAGGARESSRRALEHADRLPIQQRYFVEGRYYNEEWRTYGRAIDAFRRGLELFPRSLALRSHLAHLYAFRESYPEAIREWDEMVDQGNAFAPDYFGHASAHAALGRFEAGTRILAEYVRRHPGRWFGHLALGWHLSQGGRLDEAAEALRRAGELRPEEPLVHNGWWRWAVLAEDWSRAEREARDMAASDDPYARWRGLVCAARTHLFAGRFSDALESYEASIQAYAEPGVYTALSHAWTARLLLQTGRPERALTEAREARRQAPGQWPELEGLFLAALAQQVLGRLAEADRSVTALEERVAAEPNPVEERQLHHLRGRLALARGDAPEAIRELARAVDLLPPRGIPLHWHALPDHVPLWYALGEAELAAGRGAEARGWFEKVATSGVEHVEHPVLYQRSHERLAVAESND